MKKFFAMVVAVAMVLSLALPAFAMTQTLPHGDEGKPGATPADAVVFSAEAPENVEAGETFDAVVSVNGSYEAHGLNLQFNYDPEVFEVVSTTNGPVMAQIQSLGGFGLLDHTTVPGSVRYGVMMPTNGFTEQGVIFTVTFRVLAGAADGNYDLEVLVLEFFNMPIGGSNTPIEHTDNGVTVTVGNPAEETPTPAPATATPVPATPTPAPATPTPAPATATPAPATPVPVTPVPGEPGEEVLLAGYYFESGNEGWIFNGVDNTNWVHSSNNPGGYDYAPFAHEGNGFIMSYSFVDYVGAYQANNWAISPAVTLPAGSARVSFYATNANVAYPEAFDVYIGTSADTSAMTLLQANVSPSSSADGPWTHYEFDLSDYAGQTIYLAFHDHCYDMYEIWIDQVEFFGAGSGDQPTPAPATPEPATPVPATPTPEPITPAPGQVVFTVDAPEYVEAGEEFDVIVRVEGEYEAHGLNLQLNYDNANFTVLGTANGEVMDQMTALNGFALLDYTTIPGSIRLGVMMPTDPFTANGIIFTATFKASESIADGQYAFVPAVEEFINFPLGGENTPIDNIAYPAYVTVGEEPVEPTEPPVEPTDEPVEPTDDPVEPTNMASFTVDHVEAVPGALVPVTVHVEGDYLAHGLTFWLDYDAEKLTVESVENGDLMNEVLGLEGFNVLDYETIEGSIRFAAVAPIPEQPFSTEGTVFTVYFRVSEDAQVGDVYVLEANVTELVYMPDSEEIAVDWESEDGSITIIDGEPVEPTEPPVEPTEPPVEPTEPPVEPTDVPVEPTEVPGEPTPEPTTPPAPPTGTIAMVGAGIAAVVAGAGIVLFRKKED